MANTANSTTLVRTSSKSASLRTTVPLWAVQQLGLAAGQKVRWTVKAENGSLLLILSPIGGD